ncbi:MAG: response regulator, partial [bacterium]|nr:response regulator [bacterium]
ANMSHELRTPMNVIIGISNMITRYYNDNLTPKQTKGLELIHQSGQRLLRLINDLLDLSKIEAGKMTLTLFPTKLGPLISDIEPMILSLLKDKDIGFNITQSPGLPDEFVTDEDKLRQVLLNLLGNAVKFTKQGEITLNIYPEGPMIYFEVRDTGIGIGEEHIHNIFDAFSQAQGSMSREYGGTGLGLTLSKKLVAILGGAITVSSKLNKGSVFRFFIPAKSETPDTQDDYDTQDLTDKLMAMPELGLDTHTGHPRPRLLIAEDEKVGRVMAEMILEHRYQLCFASSGKEVVDSYFSFRPDIVLMDIIMPGMDGYQAFDAIRSAAVEKPVPIIAMTGQAMEEEKKEILAHGFDGYISKPVDEQLLIETIDRLLQKSTKRG